MDIFCVIRRLLKLKLAPCVAVVQLFLPWEILDLPTYLFSLYLDSLKVGQAVRLVEVVVVVLAYALIALYFVGKLEVSCQGGFHIYDTPKCR